MCGNYELMQGVITNVQEGYLFMNILKEKIERVNYENYSCCPYIDGFKGICRFNETIETGLLEVTVNTNYLKEKLIINVKV